MNAIAKVDPDAAILFLDFIRARDFAWRARQDGAPQPWCIDPIVAGKKFTNVFRVLDYGSQFVLTDLIEDVEPRDQLMRLFLYRHTGRVEAWQYLPIMLGRYPLTGDLEEVRELWQTYRGEAKPNWSGSTTPGGEGGWGRLFKNRIFTSAYMVFPQSIEKGTDKLDSIIDLTYRLFETGTLWRDFELAGNQLQRFHAMRSHKGVADFMSMQILTDWGYTTEFREDEFVVAGPGARKGAAVLGLGPDEGVRWAVEAIRAMPETPMLGGRPVSYMDAQNCLCEFSKYVRYLKKPVPTKPYQPAHPGPLPYQLPAHW